MYIHIYACTNVFLRCLGVMLVFHHYFGETVSVVFKIKWLDKDGSNLEIRLKTNLQYINNYKFYFINQFYNIILNLKFFSYELSNLLFVKSNKLK